MPVASWKGKLAVVALICSLVAVCSAAARAAGDYYPVEFGFDPADVENADAVVVSIRGLQFAKLPSDLPSLLMYLGHNELSVIARSPANSRGGVSRGGAAMLKDMRLRPDYKPFPPAARSRGGRSSVASELVDIFTGTDRHMGVTYLEDSLNSGREQHGKNFVVIPLRWSTDPNDSRASINNFKLWMSEAYACARKYHKPFYVVSHSWGTVLAYQTLTELAAEGSPVHADLLMTLGSPIVPSAWWSRVFVNGEHFYNYMSAEVAKPDNVSHWVNIWALYDPISNEIPQADVNLRVDSRADELSELLQKAISNAAWNFSDPAPALYDLVMLESVGRWHASYFEDYHHYFNSIGRDMDSVIFVPDVLSRL